MTIQNKEAEVQNQQLIDCVKNEVVSNATQTIFDELLALENMKNFSEILATEIAAEFMNQTFFSENLELTTLQKERLVSFIEAVSQRAKAHYLTKIKKDERTKKIADLVGFNLSAILEEMLSNLAGEVNRGALINCVAVAADTKNEKYNKIELNTYKTAGDITIPTRCLLVSTNCLDLIKSSIEQKLEEVKEND